MCPVGPSPRSPLRSGVRAPIPIFGFFSVLGGHNSGMHPHMTDRKSDRLRGLTLAVLDPSHTKPRLFCFLDCPSLPHRPSERSGQLFRGPCATYQCITASGGLRTPQRAGWLPGAMRPLHLALRRETTARHWRSSPGMCSPAPTRAPDAKTASRWLALGSAALFLTPLSLLCPLLSRVTPSHDHD